jgi:leucine dehydrogenase
VRDAAALEAVAPTPVMRELIAGWDGVDVVVRYDPSTGAWIFIALHDYTLGVPTGGLRMKVYDRPEDGLVDALRLAEGMTNKWAAMDLPFGGGKSVIALERALDTDERERVLLGFGGLLNLLGGAYGTGEDLGTTPDDMRLLASISEHVIGVHGRDSGPMDPGPYTALGVFEGIRAAVRHRDGSDDLAGRAVLVQGVGHVGEPLARRLVDAGAEVILSDVDDRRAYALADELGVETVAHDRVDRTVCDVYAPCAVGATLNARTIPQLRCLIVAGAANNQLETDADAHRLHDRGILYAPDYVINGGGAMAFTLIHRGEDRVVELERRVRAIGATLDSVFAEATENAESPATAAHRLVDRVLARGPK